MRQPILWSCLFALSGMAACSQTSPAPAADHVEDSHSSASSKAVAPFETHAINRVFSAPSLASFKTLIPALEAEVEGAEEDSSARLALIYALLRRDKYTEATPHIDRLMSELERLSPEEQAWAAALAARHADDIPLETKLWEDITRTQPTARWAWYELATKYYRSERYAETVAAIETALDIAPDESDWLASHIHYLHSKASFRIGAYAKAIETAEPGVRNPETRRPSYYRKAMAQIAKGDVSDPAEVLAQYRDYSAVDGQVNDVFYNANVSLFFFELGDYETAEDYARKSYALSKGTYPSFVLGYSLTELGQTSAAIEILEAANRRHPKNVNLLGALGWAYYRAGDYDLALETLQHARVAAPRKHTAIERDIKIVEATLSEAQPIAAPPVRWFGD